MVSRKEADIMNLRPAPLLVLRLDMTGVTPEKRTERGKSGRGHDGLLKKLILDFHMKSGKPWAGSIDKARSCCGATASDELGSITNEIFT